MVAHRWLPPDDRNRPARPSSPLCFRRFKCILQLFHLCAAKVDQGMLHMLQVLACCKCLFKIFHLFSDICCNHFLSGCCICFTYILQQYVPNISAILVLCCNGFSCCKLQVFYLGVSLVLHTCCKYVF
jgi:hypothetical protein